MRIISQDGAIDIPYERFIISVNMQNQGEIIAWTGNNISDDECIAMAIYSSSEKAQKAMEILREKYKDYAKATNKSNFFTMFDYPKVFQFPQDEDVEV